MTTDYRIVGPFSQTLFLGCSISEINMTLAWASENSACSVKLVNDMVAHEASLPYAALNTTMTNLVTNNLANNSQLPGDQQSQNSFRPIAKFETDKLTTHTTVDRAGSTHINVRDIGKKLWDPYASPNTPPKHWLGADPGFMGETYSILGSPCQVKFQDLAFAGFISRWSFENAVYNVELVGPGNLLKGTKLILGDYYGTVSTTVQDVSLPYPDATNPDALNSFNGTIDNGNIPNLINIFGALESDPPLGFGFGGSRTSEFGVNASRVYDMLVFLLDNNAVQRNAFSPYGGLVSRGPMSLVRGLLNPQQESISDGMGGIFKLTDFGLFRTIVGPDGLHRCIFRLDMRQVPRPAENIYLPATNNMQLDEFIDFCCRGAGCDWNASIEPDLSGSFSGRVVVNTYSRRVQITPTILKNFIRNFTARDNVVSYDVGEEYKDQNVRKVIMGGKQERLYQVCSNTVSRIKSAKIYNPFTNVWIDTSNINNANLSNPLGHNTNLVKIPLADSQRMSYAWKFLGAAVTAQGSEDVNETYTSAMGINVRKGNSKIGMPKLSSVNDSLGGALGGGFSGGAAYPLHLDLISPYFGRGFDGNLRKVFYDKKRRQMLINVPLADLGHIFPVLSLNPGFITIYENEIRAALGSFDSWLTYIFEPTKYDIWKPTARLIFTAISAILATTNITISSLRTSGITKDQGKDANPFGTYHTGDAIDPIQSILSSNAVMPILQGLFDYISQELGQHYGKNYSVRVPSVKRYVGDDGVARYDWEITESGWEEPGNIIDDTMEVGDINASLLTSENGKFGPILGWNNSQETDYVWPVVDLNITPDAQQSTMRDLMMDLSTTAGTYANTIYYPLKTTSDGISIRTRGANTDSFGVPVGFIDKFYQKASILDISPENLINKKLLFDTLVGGCYCVISAPSQVCLHGSNSLETAIYEDCAAELIEGTENASYYSTISLQYMFQRFLANAQNIGSYLLFMTAISSSAFREAVAPATTFSLNNENNMPIFSKAAVPCFAAIPVKYNKFLYGPWSTAPRLISDILFPNTNSLFWANNVVGGVDIVIDPQYVPWEYGGLENLDDAVLAILNDSNEYQQIEENGKITLAGIMLNNTRIGQRLQGAGPVCNGVAITFGPDGVKTTYSFRTFNRKLGYFNQENAQNIQRFGKQALALRSQIVENINTIRQLRSNNGLASAGSYSAPKSMSFSPVNVLMGSARPFIHKNSSVNNFTDECNFDPGWPQRPTLPTNINSNPVAPKHIASVSLYDPAEINRALFRDEQSYAQKSVMSLDGIFSPVSLYPTPYYSTYSLSKYKRSKCPMCMGGGTYTYASVNESMLRSATNVAGMTAGAQLSETMACPYCLPDKEIDTLKGKGVEPSELTPPFLIASGTDRQIISNSTSNNSGNLPVINNYNYNPIVISNNNSEFSISSAKQLDDFCGHSIDAVAFGNVMPKPGDALRSALSKTPSKNHDYLDSNADNPNFTQNHRFFGLRGPLILHSWGYDTEGYPVPNSSGEYKLNGTEPVLDNDGNPVGKNQVQQGDGKWSAPYKESTFMRSWAQQPASWPVGPIDLRWDSNASVWTIGANYKPVWVVIEHDLVNEDPVRGIIIESTYSNNPLPSGLRKVAFVKDNVGMFSAPRGAALYCRYDSANGFYEPVYGVTLVTSGLIQGSRTATIYTAYTPSMVSEDIVSEYNTVFDNPLNLQFNTNSIGLFVFLNGKWILQAARA